MIWEPAIYEHKAALIGRTPTEVSKDAFLLSEALVAEAETYHADYLTAGIDVYNLEAEACGAELIESSMVSAAEIPIPRWNLEAEFAVGTAGREPAEPDFRRVGRFTAVIEAAERARDKLALSSASTPILRVAASGPVSIATKLVGTESLLVAAAMEEPSAANALAYATRLCLQWSNMIRAAGFDVLIVDSSASPPLFGPSLYGSSVAPCHRQVMNFLRDSGQKVRPLIMGGDTVEIAAAIIATGATSLICDFAADAAKFAAALAVPAAPTDVPPNAAARTGAARGTDGIVNRRSAPPGEADAPLAVRRNIAPSAINDVARRDEVADQAAVDLAVLPGAILGTGILSYEQDPQTVLSFRDAVAARVG